MRNTITHKTLLGLALPATVALLLTAAPALAQSQTRSRTLSTTTNHSPGTMTVVSSESIDGDDDATVKSETIEIRVHDGEVSVRQNGKDIPDARVVHKDGRVIILDENGKELKDIKLGMFTGPGGYFYRLGGAGADGQHLDAGSLYPRLLTAAGAWRGAGGAEAGVGENPKVMIGVHMGEPGAALEKHLHLDAGKTTMITAVFEGLPAEQAGIGEYDIIVGVDGSDSADADAVREALQSKEPGDTVTLHVIQAGKEKDIKIKLQAYDAEKMHAAKLIGQAPEGLAGGGAALLPGRLFGEMKDWNVELPEGLLDHQVWVTPPGGVEWQGDWSQLQRLQPQLKELQPKFEELQPLIQQQLQDALKGYRLQTGGENGDDVEKQLDRLDERLSQLEKMLQKLIDKQAKP